MTESFYLSSFFNSCLAKANIQLDAFVINPLNTLKTGKIVNSF